MSLAVKKYSKALFEIGEAENCLDEIYEQFKAVKEQIIADRDFAKIVDTKILTAREKKDVFEKILADANPYLLNFFRVLVDNDRTEELREIFAAFEDAYKDHKNILEATAVTAIALSPRNWKTSNRPSAKSTQRPFILTIRSMRALSEE